MASPRILVFVAPFPMETTLRFARAAASLTQVRCVGVFQGAPTPGLFQHIELCSDVMNPDVLTPAILRATGGVRPDRIIGVLEQLQGPLAEARARLGVDGTDPQTAERFRDKALMKDMLREHGLPCARHARVNSDQAARDFVAKNGYPVVIKPLDGAGCKATYRIQDPAQLERALAELRPSASRRLIIEEFLVGDEFSFETITLGGEPRFHSIGRYLPTPLEAVENPHLQWVCMLPRHIDGDDFAPAREVGLRAVRALGLKDGFSHMEWFRRRDGSVAIGEIAQRPPGAQIVRLMSFVYDVDMYRVWARAVVDGTFDGPWERKYSAGCAFLRGAGHGRVTAVEGLDAAQAKMGAHVVEVNLPKVGAPRSDSYEGDGFVIVRHPDTRVVMDALHQLISTVRVHYDGR